MGIKYVYCEHCKLQPTHTPEITVDGVSWCIWCAYANGDISKEQFEEYKRLDKIKDK